MKNRAERVYCYVPPRHLYIHVPFCARRCSYCDFSIAVRRETPVDEYLEALRRELGMIAREMQLTGAGAWTLDTVYLGGGTPSRLGAAIPRVFDMAREVATIAPDAEVTIEANPEDVSPETAGEWLRAGANRISLGAQSFDDSVLSWMHRAHPAGQIARAVESAKGAGFDNVSLDLIFALPRSLNRDWKRDLDEAIALDPAHISLYGLSIEPRTPLSRWRDRGEVREAGDDAYETEFLLAHDALRAAGYEHYEVSNFAKAGRHSRHNSAYWSGAEYSGIGPSAHSFDGARRWWNVAPYAEWIRRLAAAESPVADLEVLDEDNLANEQVYLGLRTLAGVRVEAGEITELQPWLDRGWAALSAVEPLAALYQAGQVVPNGGPFAGASSRRRSSSEGTPAGTTWPTCTAIPSFETSNAKLRLTPNGWLLLDELAANLTWIRSRSYV